MAPDSVRKPSPKPQVIEEVYKGCSITATRHGYTITGALTHTVDLTTQFLDHVEPGKDKIAVPGPSCSIHTNMQRAKLWIDRHG